MEHTALTHWNEKLGEALTNPALNICFAYCCLENLNKEWQQQWQ